MTFAPSTVTVERGDVYGVSGTRPDDVCLRASEGSSTGTAPTRPRSTWARSSTRAVGTFTQYGRRAGADVWTGGYKTIVHWKDGVLAAFDLGSARSTTRIHSIWGTSPSDVWAVGDRDPDDSNEHRLGLALHWDGKAWMTMAVDDASFRQVLGVADGRVWLVPSGSCLGSGPESGVRVPAE